MKQHVGKSISGVYIVRHFTKKISSTSKFRSYFICKCKCGALFEKRAEHIVNGTTTHCGCQKRKDYKNACKECGKPRDQRYERALCHSCFKLYSKHQQRAKKRGIFRQPSKEYILDSSVKYNVTKCSICDITFLPCMKKNTRCGTCRTFAGVVYRKVRTRHRSHKKRPLLGADLDKITHEYMAATNCTYCGREYSSLVTKSLDHIIPVSLGGDNGQSNINVCCLTCNLMKGGLTLELWLDMCARICKLRQ